MEGNFVIEFIPRSVQKSEYDWANISDGDVRVGKARCKKEGKTLIIFSINVYQDFEGKGYAKTFIEEAKKEYETLIADKVRKTAIGFWEKMGFVAIGDGNWILEN